MRRPIAVVLSAAVISQGLGGAVVLASPQAPRADWTRVAALEPNQKVVVEPQKGRGKNQTGRFVSCDTNFIILRNKKGQDIAVTKEDIRRVSAVTPGRESFGVLGLMVAVGGGVGVGVRQASRINRCQSLDCYFNDRFDATYYLLMGAVTVVAMAVASKGNPRRVYEVPKIEPPSAAPRTEAGAVPNAALEAATVSPGIDPTRVIAAFRHMPASGLRLGGTFSRAPMAAPSSESNSSEPVSGRARSLARGW